jgi:hypothetical protein
MIETKLEDMNDGMTDEEEDEVFQEATEEGLLDEDEN